ncbi:MAG: sel1 repeat family protein [Betaproteobacteria bacterium]|nr:sel1 repeat family protein [Betaproteobacteria bacterium]
MRWLYQLALIASLLFPLLSGAQQTEQTKNSFCRDRIDTVGCLFNLARLKSKQIESLDDQAAAFAELLRSLSALKRTDFESIERARLLLSNPKLEIGRRLDLQVAVATYLFPYDPENAEWHLLQASTIFLSEMDKDKRSINADLFLWACGLIDETREVWTSLIRITTKYCKPLTSEHQNNVALSSALFWELYASWIQSDLEGFKTRNKLLYQTVKEIKDRAQIRTDSKLMHAAMSVGAYHDLLLADFYHREGQLEARDESTARAMRTLRELESRGANLASYELKLEISGFYSITQDFERSLELLSGMGKNFSKGTTSKLPKSIQAKYFTYLAYATGKGGFKNDNDIKLDLIQKRQRRADVLFERYLLLSEAEESSGRISQSTLQALEAAAGASHPHALHTLGLLTGNGLKGIPKDLRKAHHYYLRSAFLGFAGAQNNLADLYENLGDERPLMGLAIYWYTQAAMQGEPTAYFSLGTLFAEGRGVPKNELLAAMWLLLAVKQLPDGNNKADATALLKEVFAGLHEDAKAFATEAANAFVPLRETDSKLEDRPN